MPCPDCVNNPHTNLKNKAYMYDGYINDYCLLFGDKSLDHELRGLSKDEIELEFILGFKSRIEREAESLKKILYKKHDDKLILVFTATGAHVDLFE